MIAMIKQQILFVKTIFVENLVIISTNLVDVYYIC